MWLRRIFEIFRRGTPLSRATVADSLPLHDAEADLFTSEDSAGSPRESHELISVKEYVSATLSFLCDTEKAERVLFSLGESDPVDLDWRKQPSYPQPYIAELREMVVIGGSRLLINSSGQILSDEICDGFRLFGLRAKWWDVELSEGPIIEKPRYDRDEGHIAEGIHLMGEHEENYFHWIVEILPRLYLYEQLAGEDGCPILISKGLNENLYRLLDLLRSQGREVIYLTPRTEYAVHRLIYPSDLARIFDVYDRAPGYDTTYVPVGLLKCMVSKIKAEIDLEGGISTKRLYVRRNSTYRRLLNEEEIENLLVQYGFVCVEPGVMSVDEQVNAFNSADIIVGPSGAALTNIIWCKAGTEIVVLHSDHPYKKYPYWDALARVSGSKIQYVSGPRANHENGYFQAHDDYRIEISALTRSIEMLLATH